MPGLPFEFSWARMESKSDTVSGGSVEKELRCIVVGVVAVAVVLRLLGFLGMACIVTFLSRGVGSRPISSFSVRVTFLSAHVVGDMDVGRVRVALTT